MLSMKTTQRSQSQNWAVLTKMTPIQINLERQSGEIGVVNITNQKQLHNRRYTGATLTVRCRVNVGEEKKASCSPGTCIFHQTDEG